jgi:hypothetical protein
MSPEWQRRAVATFLTVLSIAPVRKIEPMLATVIGIDGVWITRVSAIAILIACFKLADMIPDHEWQWTLRRPRPGAGMLVVATCIFLALLVTVAH